MPCGRCRQLLWEHGGPGCLVHTVDGILTMAQVLPDAFDAEDLRTRGYRQDETHDAGSRDMPARRPKVLLHDHLDGGLRPRTVVELAAETGYELPVTDADGARPPGSARRPTPARWCGTSRPSRTPSR